MSHHPLRGENLISIILGDYQLNPHTQTHAKHTRLKGDQRW